MKPRIFLLVETISDLLSVELTFFQLQTKYIFKEHITKLKKTLACNQDPITFTTPSTLTVSWKYNLICCLVTIHWKQNLASGN